MRKVLLLALAAIGLAACNKEHQVVDDGYKLPEIVVTDEVIASQDGAIDDAAFVDALHNKVLYIPVQFTYRGDRWAFDTFASLENHTWKDVCDPATSYIGVVSPHLFYADGRYEIRRVQPANTTLAEVIASPNDWPPTQGNYRYDEDTNTLRTIIGGDKELVAEVLYFDGVNAIIEGELFTEISFGTDAKNRYICKFEDSRDKYTTTDRAIIEEAIASQNGDIDDDTLIAALCSSAIYTEIYYIYEEVGNWEAVVYFGGDPSFCCSFEENSYATYKLIRQGYPGYDTSGEFEAVYDNEYSYDRATNTICSSAYRDIKADKLVEGLNYSAEVLYFDGEVVIFDGVLCHDARYLADNPALRYIYIMKFDAALRDRLPM